LIGKQVQDSYTQVNAYSTAISKTASLAPKEIIVYFNFYSDTFKLNL